MAMIDPGDSRILPPADLIDLAARAVAVWGVPAAPPVLVQARENAVFDVRLTDGRRVALRLHRAGYQGRDRVASELRWMESLADTGFPCPWPQRSINNALCDDCTGVVASALQWIDAPSIAARGTASAPTTGEQAVLYNAIGGLLADLHLTSDAVAPLDLDRPAWLVGAFCDTDKPIWGRFWENPALSTSDSRLLIAARDAAQGRLAAIPAAQIGLIHADVLRENVLQDGAQLYLIDFDDGGTGYRMYDLATALIQHCDAPNFADLRAAVLDGYGAGGGLLPAAVQDDIDLFVMLRALVSAGWVIGRLQANDPRVALYADRAVRLARAWLG
jgi:Ser/Thr protein kinase RdoA (MazF antagonist)